MKTFTKRMATGAAVVAGIVGLGAGVGFAAAPFSEATADYGEAHATAAGIPGLVTVSETHAEGSYPFGSDGNVSYLKVADENLIGRGSNGKWNGTLKAAGDVVDTANSLTCGKHGVKVPAGADSATVCALVLPGSVSGGPMAGGASAALASVSVDTEGDTLSESSTVARVAPSSSASFFGCSTSSASVADLHSTVTDPVELGGDAAQSNCDFETR